MSNPTVTEAFRAVEPLRLDDPNRTDAWVNKVGVVCLHQITYTVAEFRALIEWGIKALPCEHKDYMISTIDYPSRKCLDCGATLP